ncbi:Thymidylate synthase 2 [compost metagenome]
MRAYLDLLKHVFENGKERSDRTGTGTVSSFGHTLRLNLQDGFPLITTKKVHDKSIKRELIWLIMGDRNGSIKYLQDNGVTIWNEWADELGMLGPVYGAQWRRWEKTGRWDKYQPPAYVDQLQGVIDTIKVNPTDRRLLVSAWNPGELNKMKLPPCHYAFQFYVDEGVLSCMVQMRSVDLFLGLPFDIASYAILTSMVAQVTDLEVGELIFNFGDTHIYLNHLEQVKEQLTREPLPLSELVLNPACRTIDDFKYEDITIIDYVSHPAIKAPISV